MKDHETKISVEVNGKELRKITHRRSVAAMALNPDSTNESLAIETLNLLVDSMESKQGNVK
jgi:hypothetical protein